MIAQNQKLFVSFEEDKKGQNQINKSNRTMMRPLGIYLIGISMYILNMIHFLMILADFAVFFLNGNGRTDIRTDRPSYRDARSHLKKHPFHQRPASDYFMSFLGRFFVSFCLKLSLSKQRLQHF